MTRSAGALFTVSLLVAAASIVVWIVHPQLAMESLAGLVLAVLVCGFGIAARLAQIEQRIAAIEFPDPTEWATVLRRLGHGTGSVQESTRRAVVRDVGALMTLHELVEVKGETPAHAPWVATPETVLALVGYVAALPDDAVILDIGSGLSTVWLALAASQQHRGISVVSLEHDANYADATSAALARQGVADAVIVRRAPLKPVDIGDREYVWYSADGYADLRDIRLVFVDGPPGSTGARARYPAFPLLAPFLADGALLVLDDTNRVEEKDIVRRWTIDTSPEGRVVVDRVLDHATVLRFEKSAA